MNDNERNISNTLQSSFKNFMTIMPISETSTNKTAQRQMLLKKRVTEPVREEEEFKAGAIIKTNREAEVGGPLIEENSRRSYS